MKTWTQVSAGAINAANQRLWVAVGDKADEVATRINTDATFVGNIARLMVKGGYTPSTSQKRAREIMGKNFFGVGEAIEYFGVNPTKQQLSYLTQVSFSEETLDTNKDTHILVAVFPFSLLDVRDIAKKQSNHTLFYNQDWYDKRAFALAKGDISWQLIRKVPVANSAWKTWHEQQALLSKDEETTTTRIVVYTMIGHYLATRECLFHSTYVRCSDLYSDGFHIGAGHFSPDYGLSIANWPDTMRYDCIGVSSALKQEFLLPLLRSCTF